MSNEPSLCTKPLRPATRGLLLAAGCLSVVLGTIGIFLPVLPTVPFLLLAATCFARSSDRFYCWLLEHAHLGPIVRPYLDGQGLKKTTKVKAIALVWNSILISALLLHERIWVQMTLVVIASGVTVYLWRLPTRDDTV